MAETRGRARLFYADGSRVDLQILGIDRIRADREKAKASVEEQAWYRLFLAAERAGLPNTGTGFDAFMTSVVDFDNLFTREQADTAFAAGQLTAEQYEAAIDQLDEEGEGPGESMAARSTSPASLCEPDSQPMGSFGSSD